MPYAASATVAPVRSAALSAARGQQHDGRQEPCDRADGCGNMAPARELAAQQCSTRHIGLPIAVLMLTGGKAPARAPGSSATWRDRLPRGSTLPPAVWERRHHAMPLLLWLHVAGLLAFAVARGLPVWHA